MADRVEVAGLSVARELHDFLNQEALPGTGVTPDRFWSSYAGILRDLAPRNAALLAKRDHLQAKIDAWHRAHPAQPVDPAAYTAFLRRDRLPRAGRPGPFRSTPPMSMPSSPSSPGRSSSCRSPTRATR